MNKLLSSSFSLLVIAASLSLPAGGCASVHDGDVASVSQADESDNGLTENALTMNALTMNALTMNALTMNALTMNALTMNSLVNSALTDPGARTVMKYIVGCALPAGASVSAESPAGSGNVYTWAGEVGLYPDWASGSCPADTCQPWVSACVIARINAAGHVVPLSIRGAALTAGAAEMALYPRADAVFFGNVFTVPQVRYACTPAGGALTRTCGAGAPAASCAAVSYLGACSSVCDTQAADGSWQGCWDTAAPHTGGTAYPASISVFLQADQVVP
jgi:hypothetical protein